MVKSNLLDLLKGSALSSEKKSSKLVGDISIIAPVLWFLMTMF